MTHDELIQILMKTDPEDWLTNDLGGGRDNWVYRHDLRLRFEMNIDDPGVANPNYREPWATRHADTQAKSYWCDLYYGSSLVRRFILVAIDGGRAMLPPPKVNAEGISNEVGIIEYKVAIVVAGREDRVDEYLDKIGLNVKMNPSLT